ncbi:MAG: stage II sporulation protein M [Candidatus Aenigmarchaeota archaeon]|nr:stage II sporulation protein M [Candidatus Aenigmarchaeota archaeon]
MLESILNFKEISKNPHLAFIWSFIITCVAIFISLQLSYEIHIGSGQIFSLTGIFSVVFTVIPLVYLMTYALKREEKIEEDEIRHHYTEKNILERHLYDILFFLFTFLGITMGYALFSFILPESVFQIQLLKISELQGSISGQLLIKNTSMFSEFFTGAITANPSAAFYTIFINNLKVLGFAFVFSLLYGCGAVFIIVWNASILGVYIGFLAENITHIPVVALSFLPHGLPEIGGYLFAGMAGGILSASLIRRHSMEITKKIFLDCLILLCVGVFLILAAAGIEAFL